MNYSCINCGKVLAGMVSLSPAHQKLLKKNRIRRLPLQRIWTFFPLNGKDQAICFACLGHAKITRYPKIVVADIFLNMAMEAKWEGHAKAAIKLAKISLEHEVRANTLCEIATLYESIGYRLAALKNFKKCLEFDPRFCFRELVATNINRLELGRGTDADH